MMSDENKYEYTYSAQEQTEIRKIREKYTLGEDKIDRLRRLDASVTKKSTVVSMLVGVLGTLIFGLGMSIILTDFGKILGIYNPMLPGIVIGIGGIILISLAHPIYMHITKKERAKIAPEIMQLTDELMK